MTSLLFVEVPFAHFAVDRDLNAAMTSDIRQELPERRTSSHRLSTILRN